MRRLQRAWILAVLLFGPGWVAAFSEIYVFGDSLSDNGTLAGAVDLDLPAPWSSEPSDFNRISNGPVAVERLATRLGLSLNPALHLDATGFPPGPTMPTGNNYAVATARARPISNIFENLPGLGTQVQSFSNYVPSVAPDALGVVFIGGNDVLDIKDQQDDAIANEVISAATGAIGQALDDLVAKGFQKLLVPNVFDIGLVPSAVATPALATQRTEEFNTALADLLADVETNENVTVFDFDLFSFSHEVIDDFGSFGFSNVTSACTDGGDIDVGLGGVTLTAPQFIGGCSEELLDEYLFFDDMHPTARAHELLGDRLAATVVPLPPAVALFAPALLALGFGVRPRKVH